MIYLEAVGTCGVCPVRGGEVQGALGVGVLSFGSIRRFKVDLIFLIGSF